MCRAVLGVLIPKGRLFQRVAYSKGALMETIDNLEELNHGSGSGRADKSVGND